MNSTGLTPLRRATRGDRAPVGRRTDSAAVLKKKPPAPAQAEALPEETVYRGFDRLLHARLGELTGGISTIGLAQALADWYLHLSIAPAKQLALVEKAFRKWQRLAGFLVTDALERDATCIDPLPQDRRFGAPDWQLPPFNMFYQSFLLTQQWWHNATTTVPGVTRQNERLVEFYSRQLLDMLSPSNFLATNPELLKRTISEGGRNLVRGYGYLLDDLAQYVTKGRSAESDAFRVGENLAATPGSVVFENRLIELIQYAPATDKCRADPVLFVPAWIMKYYILDLSKEKSLIRYLVEQGHTVFCISWKNPDAEDRELSMDDYRQLGVMAAIEAVQAITGTDRIHAAGYCLGGTLLMIAAAAMARDGDRRLASMSLLAAQADFTEAGELSLFVNESQLSLIEDMMWSDGYLDQRRMTGAFRLLRSRDLIWSRVVHEYLMGERRSANDFMAWNADATRMPYRMHSEYLRNLFLNNDLAENRLAAGGSPVYLDEIDVPTFAVATERDHVAPWKSVVKIFHLIETDISFVLASGGHNTGIIAPPDEKLAKHKNLAHIDRYMSPQEQIDRTPWKDGSWWPTWQKWLADRSGELGVCPPLGNPDAGYPAIRKAPGKYVQEG